MGGTEELVLAHEGVMFLHSIISFHISALLLRVIAQKMSMTLLYLSGCNIAMNDLACSLT